MLKHITCLSNIKIKMPCNLCMSYKYKPNSLHVVQLQKKNSVKNFTNLNFFLIGQVEYGVSALVVQALDSAIQQINHYAVDKYWEN